MMLLGFLFELEDINLHKKAPHNLVIPAEKTKLGITPLLPQSHVVFCKYILLSPQNKKLFEQIFGFGVDYFFPPFLGFKT